MKYPAFVFNQLSAAPLTPDNPYHKSLSVPDLSQLGKGRGKGKSFAVIRLGNDFSHSENYHQKKPPILFSSLHKEELVT